MGIRSTVFDIPCFRKDNGDYGLHPTIEAEGWYGFLGETADRYRAMHKKGTDRSRIMLRNVQGLTRSNAQRSDLGVLAENDHRGLVAFAGALHKHFPEIAGPRWLLHIYTGPVTDAARARRMIEAVETVLGESVMVTWVFDSVGGVNLKKLPAPINGVTHVPSEQATVGVETYILLGWLMERRKAKNVHRLIGYEPGPWSGVAGEAVLQGPCVLTDDNWAQLPPDRRLIPKSVMILLKQSLDPNTPADREKTMNQCVANCKADPRLAYSVHYDERDSELADRLIAI